MDPRHPEIILPRIKELVAHYRRVENDIKNATTASQLGQLEREGGLVVQEICLTAPRLHESMINISRQRRSEIARGLNFGYVPEERVGKYIKATIGKKDTVEEIPTPPNQAETEIAVLKPRKKKAKRAKKARK